MNSVNDLYRKRQGQSLTACPPDECVCSTCGMLECLCRPRFFAGQILTADDLNRLDGYIRGKNRLHNRQLHGWGVVNGLEVTCNPCGDGVAVGCGYALSPCGDDIVVCDAVSVDICELIRRCRDAEHKWNPCEPPYRPKPQHCDGGEEEWILAIRYAESPARGVKPLRPAADCACGGSKGKCGCGGACGGGKCSCGTSSPAKPRGAPVQCEPTVICEGFAFEVYRKPPDQPDRPGNNQPGVLNPDSPLRERFDCCTRLLITQMPALPGPIKLATTEAEAQQWFQWINGARAQLRRYFGSHGSYNCDLLHQFDTIPYPPAGTLANAGAILLAVVLLWIVWFDAVLACFCSAILPPCPPPSNEVRVPLASIHVAGKPCRVARICNWTVHRKIATTFPALQYWLGLLPFGTMLRQSLEKLCCFDIGAVLTPPRELRGAEGPEHLMAMHHVEAGGASPEEQQAHAAYQRANALLNPVLEQPQRIGAAFELLMGALGRSGKTLELNTLIESLMLAQGKQGPGHLTAGETANLPQFLMANMLRPIAAEAVGPAGAMLAQRGMAPAGGMAEMRNRLDELSAMVRAQATEIEQLKRGRPAAPPRPKRKPPG